MKRRRFAIDHTNWEECAEAKRSDWTLGPDRGSPCALDSSKDCTSKRGRTGSQGALRRSRACRARAGMRRGLVAITLKRDSADGPAVIRATRSIDGDRLCAEVEGRRRWMMRSFARTAWCVIETPKVCSPSEPLAGFARWARRRDRLGRGDRLGTDDQDGTRRRSNELLSDRPEEGTIHSRAIVVSDDDEVGMDVLG
jgi:hypothetical protein